MERPTAKVVRASSHGHAAHVMNRYDIQTIVAVLNLTQAGFHVDKHNRLTRRSTPARPTSQEELILLYKHTAHAH